MTEEIIDDWFEEIAGAFDRGEFPTNTIVSTHPSGCVCYYKNMYGRRVRFWVEKGHEIIWFDAIGP